MVWVDDLQWVDSPSLQFLAYLSRRLTGLPVMLLSGRRPALPGEDRTLVDAIVSTRDTLLVEPRPLSVAAVAILAEDRLGTARDPAFAEELRRVTGGNALLVDEALRELAATGADADAGWRRPASSGSGEVCGGGSTGCLAPRPLWPRRWPSSATAAAWRRRARWRAWRPQASVNEILSNPSTYSRPQTMSQYKCSETDVHMNGYVLGHAYWRWIERMNAMGLPGREIAGQILTYIPMNLPAKRTFGEVRQSFASIVAALHGSTSNVEAALWLAFKNDAGILLSHSRKALGCSNE